MARPSDQQVQMRDCGMELVTVVNKKAEDLETLLALHEDIPDQDRQAVTHMLNQAQACFQWANNKALNLVSAGKAA